MACRSTRSRPGPGYVHRHGLPALPGQGGAVRGGGCGQADQPGPRRAGPGRRRGRPGRGGCSAGSAGSPGRPRPSATCPMRSRSPGRCGRTWWRRWATCWSARSGRAHRRRPCQQLAMFFFFFFFFFASTWLSHMLSSTDCHSVRRRTAPLSSRAMSSRLPTSALSSRACATMARAASRLRPSRQVRLQRFGQRDQRGERRAHVVRDGAEQRIAQALRFDLDHRALRHVHVVHPLQRNGDLARQRVELLRLLRNQQPARLRGLQRQHAAHAHRRLQRHVVPALRRQCGGAPGPRAARGGRPSRPRWRRSRRAACSGSSRRSASSVTSTSAGPPKWRCTAAAPMRHHLLGLQRGREFARELEQRLRAPLAAGRHAGGKAQPRGELPDQQADGRASPRRSRRYCQSLTREGQARRRQRRSRRPPR